MKKIVLDRLDQYNTDDECWQEILVPDKSCTPAELAASRIDMPAWFDSLRPRVRRIAKFLANGESTKAAAKKFGVSQGRVSQVRRELSESWKRFVYDEPGPAAAA